ncbi:tryptophanase [Fretibacterium sp. OH1220_COT-178]|uniref:tryptophanase n=1 Tax=Fretibacterium sp. OH1220_COT-178 TaxID=2491047 RepID=UPI000F5F3D39|nr:tryptophanase [Fretibacterium sp. OH1220_COT-178]RRD64365.1 tryptophanase [Fretibacterium sp. OH1220_COT-178]
MNGQVKFFGGEVFPLEMHKVRIVQKLTLVPVEDRLAALREAGCNTFLLKNDKVFLDMLTDSGVNAMSDRQLAAMMTADDSYAGSMSFERLKAVVEDIFGKPFLLPVHQGRAAENILASALVGRGNVVPMNYHFTTTRAHIERNGGRVEELFLPEALNLDSADPFKGNMDTKGLEALLKREAGNVPFVRVEAGTNLIGGQPWSLENLSETAEICRRHKVPLVLDASLLADNLYFIKTREVAQRDASIREITRRIADLCDIVYFSARKLGCARGGAILTGDRALFERMQPLIPLFEGFLTYGGMSVREIEALAVGLEETMDFDMIRHGPEFIGFMADALHERGIPVVRPAGGLGCHLNAREFLPHVPQERYTAGALAAAVFLAGGIRGMERGTLSEERREDGSERLADVELLRLALPRRVFTMSQLKYAVDRIHWLFENRELVGGLKWVEEPKLLRFFSGRLEPLGDWQERLCAKFRADFGDSL